MADGELNSDYSNINTTTRNYITAFFGATKELIAYDKQQTYSLNSGNQLTYKDDGTGGTWPNAIFGVFGNADGTALTSFTITNSSQGAKALSSNEIQINTNYNFTTGRWVWRAIGLA